MIHIGPNDLDEVISCHSSRRTNHLALELRIKPMWHVFSTQSTDVKVNPMVAKQPASSKNPRSTTPSKGDRAASDTSAETNLPPVSRQTAGGIVGATLGGMVGGPVGAVVGGVAGAMVGSSSAAGERPIETAVDKIASVGKKPVKAVIEKVKSVMAARRSPTAKSKGTKKVEKMTSPGKSGATKQKSTKKRSTATSKASAKRG